MTCDQALAKCEPGLVAAIDLDAPRVVWSWGEGELSGQHQPSALPSGNLLVFDNGMTVGRSRVLEVDPATRMIAWEWTTAKLPSSSRTSRVTLYRMASLPAATVERILGPQQAPAPTAVVVSP